MEVFLPIWNPLVVHPLQTVLVFLADLTNSGGLAIILMTILVKAILLPLTMKQTASMKRMQALQPEIKAIQQKYKDDRQRITQETMELYKRYGVNPAAGCLPMVPMFVVLIGLYAALQNLSNATMNGQENPQFNEHFAQPFLWVTSLGHPDTFEVLGVHLPFLLPIIMAITQFISSKMMVMPSADPQQQMMNRMTTIIMPAMMLFYGVTFPAGLVLYWTTSNLMEIVRLYFTVGRNPAPATPAATGESSGGLFSFMNRSNGTTASLPTPESTTASTGRSEDSSERDGRAASRRPKRGKRHGRR